MIAVPKLTGALSYTDAGRRAANAPARVSVTLRYNHQGELDRLVAGISDPHSGSHRHFLTAKEFNEHFAPTPEQERRVVRELERAGFKIEKRYPNRTIVDATARTTAVEQFFSTQIHAVHQGKYGDRYTNVTPATVPKAIAPLVRDVSVNNLVVVRTVADQSGVETQRTAPVFQTDTQGRTIVPLGGIQPNDSSGQLVNGNFASGSLNPGWTNESTTSGNYVSITTAQSYQSTYSAFMGTLGPPEINGWAAIAQEVKVPTGGVLSFWVYQGSNEGTMGYGTRYAWNAGYLLNSRGSILVTFYKTVANTNGWVNYQVNLSRYAGQTDYIYFGSFGDGYSQTYLYQYLDDVAWAGATPSPSPTPTAKPTATPTVSPTATPTAKPTATPTAGPTATPTAQPTATPTPSANCNNAAPDNGPLTNSTGTLATGVAKPFDFPVQHGCNGAGYTAAIVIDDPVNKSYVSTYLSASGITQSGTVTNEAVDGGGSGDDPETDLDVQTISGLAPGANVIVYDIGSLGDQQIEDAYNQVLTDAKATAVNSSFGGCESSDVPFADSTNSIAEQGAAEGVEFSASSGDSGSNECSGSKGVSAPAGGPYFSSIGGINFTDTSGGVLETVTMGSEDGDSGGGGVSTVFALPSYQSGITGMITTGRNQPDISLPFFPVAVYTGGKWGEYLGTSWSSPASVALIIEANELHGSKLGWIDPGVYSLFSATGYSSYYTPCTSGSNGAYSCNATRYNQAAGIGAPKGWALANAL
ncbi:MAG TPA: protease pro-enzyme activation domain-containing protein [Candidatus Cybelea sp.]|jgi:subtilase family serine protease